jgi:hypothetical protein
MPWCLSGCRIKQQPDRMNINKLEATPVANAKELKNQKAPKAKAGDDRELKNFKSAPAGMKLRLCPKPGSGGTAKAGASSSAPAQPEPQLYLSRNQNLTFRLWSAPVFARKRRLLAMVERQCKCIVSRAFDAYSMGLLAVEIPPLRNPGTPNILASATSNIPRW